MIKKPPLGIMPYYLYEEQLAEMEDKILEFRTNRWIHLGNVMIAYIEQGLAIDIKWVEEYNNYLKSVGAL